MLKACDHGKRVTVTLPIDLWDRFQDHKEELEWRRGETISDAALFRALVEEQLDLEAPQMEECEEIEEEEEETGKRLASAILEQMGRIMLEASANPDRWAD